MRSDKYKRAMQQYDGFKGNQTVNHIMDSIPASLKESITGRQLGQVMSVSNQAYQEGKSCGLEIIDDCVWVPSPSNDDPQAGKLIPLAVLRQIAISQATNRKTVMSESADHAYNYHTIYRDEQLTDKITDRLDAYNMRVQGLPCYYQMRESHRTYTLNHTETM